MYKNVLFINVMFGFCLTLWDITTAFPQRLLVNGAEDQHAPNQTELLSIEALKNLFNRQNNFSNFVPLQNISEQQFHLQSVPISFKTDRDLDEIVGEGFSEKVDHQHARPWTEEVLSQNPPPISNALQHMHSSLFSALNNDKPEDFDRVQDQISNIAEQLNLREIQERDSSYSHAGSQEDQTSSIFDEDVSSMESKRGTPQYMLDLYEKFENDPMIQPTSNIVRSFFNQATPEKQNAYHDRYIICAETIKAESCPRIHHLHFDITSIPDHERITLAELRLYKIVERDRRKYMGLDRKVEVVEVIRSYNSNHTTSHVHRNVLDSRLIIGRKSGWETFFITKAVQRWVKHKNSIGHELEIYIENISAASEEDVVDFEQNSKTTNEPLLVVFSDDVSKHHRLERAEELQELLNHSKRSKLSKKHLPTSEKNKVLRKMAKTTTSKRPKRSIHEPCHLENMYVNFKDIGYDSWVIGPRGYRAGQCIGTCNFPFYGISVSPHAMIQNLMHGVSPAEYKKPCCIPIKLGPIALLYFEKNALTYKRMYEGMKVLKCGCR